jgi:PAS domain S-box-containing protein
MDSLPFENQILDLILSNFIETFFIVNQNFEVVYYDNRFLNWLDKLGLNLIHNRENIVSSLLGSELTSELIPFFRKIFDDPQKDSFEIKFAFQNQFLILRFDFIPIIISESVQWIITTIHDLTQEKSKYYEQAMELQSSKIISMISSILLDNNLDETIPNVLRIMVNTLHCDSVSIFQLDRNHEGHFGLKWQNSSIGSADFDTSIIIPSQFQKFLEDKLTTEMYFTSNVEENVPEIDQFLELFHYTNILIVPVIINPKLHYDMIIDSQNPLQKWSKPEIHMILTLSILIGLTLKSAFKQEIHNSIIDELNQVHIGTFIYQILSENEGKFIFENQSFLDHLGYSKTELAEINLLEIFLNDYPSSSKNCFHQFMMDSTSSYNSYFELKTRTGSFSRKLVFLSKKNINDQNMIDGFVFDDLYTVQN